MTDSDESLEREIEQAEKRIAFVKAAIERHKRSLEDNYAILSFNNTQLDRLKSMRRKATP